mgnify:CR=1 FL=1
MKAGAAAKRKYETHGVSSAVHWWTLTRLALAKVARRCRKRASSPPPYSPDDEDAMDRWFAEHRDPQRPPATKRQRQIEAEDARDNAIEVAREIIDRLGIAHLKIGELVIYSEDNRAS